MNDKNQISDELLAAFLDGNTNAEDTMRVLNAAEQDMELQEIIRIASGYGYNCKANDYTDDCYGSKNKGDLPM